MPKIRYEAINLRRSSLEVIAKANEVIADYLDAGYRLTLRQLYYQFVARGWLPNKQSEYKRLGSIINDARLAGLIDWDAIEDRGRNLQSFSYWPDPGAGLETLADQFALNPWAEQDAYLEVWVEKEALLGVVAVPCDKWRVPHFACKGYTSQSEIWTAGHHRLRRKAADGKAITIIHLGDHDPSGIDMTRDIRDRLSLFTRQSVEVKRIALNMDQVEEWKPPPNPAKTTDSRFEAYAELYGWESWELDALEPTTIGELIEAEIEAVLDREAWDKVIEQEDGNKLELRLIADHYDGVIEFVNDQA